VSIRYSAGWSRLVFLPRECNSDAGLPINMTEYESEHSVHGPRDVIQRLTQAFGKLPQVLAVVLGVRVAAATSDVAIRLRSPTCITVREVPSIFDGHLWGRARKSTIASGTRRRVERYPFAGAHIDIMYRSPEWIEGQIEAHLYQRHEASLGYTTMFLVQTSFIPKHYLTREVGIRDCRIVPAWRIPKGSEVRYGERTGPCSAKPFIVSTPKIEIALNRW